MAEREHLIGLARRGPGYAEDYAAWVDHQIALLRARRWSDLDLDHLIDEVADLGKSEFNGFVSAIEVVIVHMLKWDVQPERRLRGWIASIAEHRRRLAQALADNPSFKSRKDEALARAFNVAVARAAAETDLPLAAFPQTNPYDWSSLTTRDHVLAS